MRPRWGDIQIDQIDHLDLQEWIQGPLSKRLKNKTIRDIISNVRQVFRLYRTRKKVAHDPTEGLFVRLPDPEAPDPFTRVEIKQILETHTSRIQELLMVQFMIWAGPRVSETIALAWEDIDLKQGSATFRRSKVRGAYRVTKTRRSTRKVRLLEPAWDALRKLDAINQLKRGDTGGKGTDLFSVKRPPLTGCRQTGWRGGGTFADEPPCPTWPFFKRQKPQTPDFL